jgi:DNA-binding transcriptional LysR family regulator
MLNEIDLSRADLNLLVFFEAVMRERNVGRAARRLNLTASAVSHRLGRLRRLLNDPLFLRTPKGVVPTDRALELAAPIAEVLLRVRSVVASAEPFDPATSARRFTIGAPDAVSGVIMHGLLEAVAAQAPRVDLSIRLTLIGASAARGIARAWEDILPDLERRELDIAVIPLEEVPPRFAARTVYEEDFVVVCREDHPFAADPTLDRFCAMRHLIVSQSGDPRGFVDEALGRIRRERRIAVAVPNFMMGLTLLAQTDLIGALPRHLAAMHCARAGLVAFELPVPVDRNQIRVVVPKAALTDAGIAWLYDTICHAIDVDGAVAGP